MFDITKASKLTVGDLADFEDWQRTCRKKELLATAKELYGSSIPAEVFKEIERELKNLPTIISGIELTLLSAQYLAWLSLKKRDHTLTLERVGEIIEIKDLAEITAFMFPASPTIPADEDDKKKE